MKRKQRQTIFGVLLHPPPLKWKRNSLKLWCSIHIRSLREYAKPTYIMYTSAFIHKGSPQLLFIKVTHVHKCMPQTTYIIRLYLSTRHNKGSQNPFERLLISCRTGIVRIDWFLLCFVYALHSYFESRWIKSTITIYPKL